MVKEFRIVGKQGTHIVELMLDVKEKNVNGLLNVYKKLFKSGDINSDVMPFVQYRYVHDWKKA